jgi:citrate synthase
MTTWNTAIADARTADITIRGYPLDALVEQVTFTDLVYLLLAGELPTAGQRAMVDAILVSLAERGIAPSSMIARSVTSAGSPLQAAVAAGLLSIGDRIGGACEQAARVFAAIAAGGEPGAPQRASEAVAEHRESRRRVPGFGYPEHESRDPRAEMLLARARATEVHGAHCEVIALVEQEVERQSGRRVPVNVNGAIAAIALDLGLTPEATRAFILIPRVAGLVAHATEEAAGPPTWRGAAAEAVDYTGPETRELP